MKGNTFIFVKNPFIHFWDWLTCKNMSLSEGKIRISLILINLIIGSFCLYFDINHMWSPATGRVTADLPLFLFWLIVFLVAYRNIIKN